jgi:antirestriction protein
VASLSDYNAGRLHGEWIDAGQEVDDLQLAVQAMLARSRESVAEEWAIHDHEGFGLLHLDEYETLATISRLALGIVEHGLAFAAWAVVLDRVSWDDELDKFGEAYRGEWSSKAEYAEQLIEDLGIDVDDIGPDLLQPYISVDLDAFARDLSGQVDFVRAPDGGFYVFEHD